MATLGQQKRVLQEVRSIPTDRMNEIFASGILSDIRAGDLSDRYAIQRALKIPLLRKQMIEPRPSPMGSLFRPNDIFEDKSWKITASPLFVEKFLSEGKGDTIVLERKKAQSIAYCDLGRGFFAPCDLLREIGEKRAVMPTSLFYNLFWNQLKDEDTGDLFCYRGNQIFFIRSEDEDLWAVTLTSLHLRGHWSIKLVSARSSVRELGLTNRGSAVYWPGE